MGSNPRPLSSLLFLIGLAITTGAAAQSNSSPDSFAPTGIVYPIHDINLSLPLDGIVTSVPVKAGQHLMKEDLLIQLDDQLQQLEVQRRKRIWEDDSQINSARENLTLLESLVATKEELFETSRTVSQSELKRNQIQLNQVQGEYQALLEAKAKAELEYRIAAEILDSYQLRAPIDGTIVDIIPSEGEWVRTGDPVIRLVDTRTCYLDLDVDLMTSRRIAKKDTQLFVQVSVGETTVRRTGSADFISAVADAGSGLLRVKVYFDNTDNAITPGITGQLIIE